MTDFAESRVFEVDSDCMTMLKAVTAVGIVGVIGLVAAVAEQFLGPFGRAMELNLILVGLVAVAPLLMTRRSG